MVNRCIAVGCSNTASDRISLFKFPKYHKLRKQWEKKVQIIWVHWKATKQSHICSKHLISDAFELDSAIAVTFAMKKRKN